MTGKHNPNFREDSILFHVLKAQLPFNIRIKDFVRTMKQLREHEKEMCDIK